MNPIDFIRFAVILLKRARRELASSDPKNAVVTDITNFLVDNNMETDELTKAKQG
jgi:hypothetical protein